MLYLSCKNVCSQYQAQGKNFFLDPRASLWSDLGYNQAKSDASDLMPTTKPNTDNLIVQKTADGTIHNMGISGFVILFCTFNTDHKFIFNAIWISPPLPHQIIPMYSRAQAETLPCNVLYWDTFWKRCSLLWSPVIEYWGDGVFVRSKYCWTRALLRLWTCKGSVREKSAHATALLAATTMT